MADNNQEKTGFVYGELKNLVGDLGKLTKLMVEKTLEAESIIARDKAHQEVELIRGHLSKAATTARDTGARAIHHMREEPVFSALTFASVAWLAWRLLRNLKK